jgi:prepilin-type N-terminal cleavage/methylation domain-containing protein
MERGDSGFTLVELLVSLVVLGILLAIALISVVGIRDRANDAAAKANVRELIPSLAAFHTDNDTYVGATATVLQQSYDQAIVPSRYTIKNLTASSYCVDSTSGNRTWRQAGPSAPLEAGPCP